MENYFSKNKKYKSLNSMKQKDYKYLYHKYKNKYISLKNLNQDKDIINKLAKLLDIINKNQNINNFSICGIPCLANEKCNKMGIFKRLGSHTINNRLNPCEEWNCI